MSNFQLKTSIARVLWLLTVLGIYIASFSGRFLQNSFPDLIRLIPFFGALLFLSIGIYLWKQKLTKPAIVMLVVLGVGAIISEGFIQFPVERIHYYKYALLGVLSYLSINNSNSYRHVLIALFAASLIGISEESAQLGIPNRFFDWRDIGINLFSAAFGVAAAFLGSRISFK